MGNNFVFYFDNQKENTQLQNKVPIDLTYFANKINESNNYFKTW